MAGPTVTITSPSSGATIQGTFDSYGTVNPTGAQMSAWIDTSQGRVTGQPVNPPHSGSDWTFHFSTNWTLNETVTLSVKGTNSQGSNTSTVSFTWKTP